MELGPQPKKVFDVILKFSTIPAYRTKNMVFCASAKIIGRELRKTVVSVKMAEQVFVQLKTHQFTSATTESNLTLLKASF